MLQIRLLFSASVSLSAPLSSLSLSLQVIQLVLFLTVSRPNSSLWLPIPFPPRGIRICYLFLTLLPINFTRPCSISSSSDPMILLIIEKVQLNLLLAFNM